MKIDHDAYVREEVIVLHEVERCPECGEIMLTEEQMDAFVEKPKRLNLWKGEYGIVRIRKGTPEYEKLVDIAEELREGNRIRNYWHLNRRKNVGEGVKEKMEELQ